MLRSLLGPPAVASLVSQAYGVGAQECVLLRTLVNDVYRIDTPAGPLVLKLYGPGRDRDAAWEARLSVRLADLGVDLARAVPLTDGRWAGKLALPEGSRQFTLWEWVPGAHPPQPFDDALYARFGEAVARFHVSAGPGPGPSSRTGNEPRLEEVLARVAEPDRSLLSRLVAASDRYLASAGPDLDRGICHGDVTMDNVHLDGDRLILFDLDLAGVDWRAADLVGVAGTPQWPAFLRGYRSVRPFPERDVAAIPWLRVPQLVEYLHFHLVRKPAFRGTDSIREGWVDLNLETLRAAAELLDKQPDRVQLGLGKRREEA